MAWQIGFGSKMINRKKIDFEKKFRLREKPIFFLAFGMREKRLPIGT